MMGHMVAKHNVRVEHPILALNYASCFALLECSPWVEPISASVAGSGVQLAPLFHGACTQGHCPTRNIKIEVHEVST
jgi:hypothetical protein